MVGHRWLAGRAVLGICVAALVFGAGCKKGSDAEASPSGAAAGNAGGAAKPEFSDDAMAFMLGRKFAFACLYTQLDKPAEAQRAMSQAQVIAGGLGVTAPSLSPKSEGFKPLRSTAIPDELTKKKNAKVAAVYSLGVSITDAWFGAMLGSNISKVLTEIESNAKAAGLAESVYKTKLDAIKAKPTEEALAKLAGDLETHYKGS